MSTFDISVTDNLDESLIDRALTEYLFSHSITPEEARQIRQHRYAIENGEARVTADEDDEQLELILQIDGDSHSVTVPKQVNSVIIDDPLADGEYCIALSDIHLVAVSLEADFPWTSEAFVSVYWAKTVDGDGHDWYEKEDIALQRYHPPRGTNPTSDAEEIVEEWHDVSIDMLVDARKPNPWEYASLCVPYENTPLAREFLQQTRYWEQDDDVYRTFGTDTRG